MDPELRFGLDATYILQKSLDLLEALADPVLVLAGQVVEGERE